MRMTSFHVEGRRHIKWSYFGEVVTDDFEENTAKTIGLIKLSNAEWLRSEGK